MLLCLTPLISRVETKINPSLTKGQEEFTDVVLSTMHAWCVLGFGSEIYPYFQGEYSSLEQRVKHIISCISVLWRQRVTVFR